MKPGRKLVGKPRPRLGVAQRKENEMMSVIGTAYGLLAVGYTIGAVGCLILCVAHASG